MKPPPSNCVSWAEHLEIIKRAHASALGDVAAADEPCGLTKDQMVARKALAQRRLAQIEAELVETEALVAEEVKWLEENRNLSPDVRARLDAVCADGPESMSMVGAQ